MEWHEPSDCPHTGLHACEKCDYDRHYARVYPDCPWRGTRPPCLECGIPLYTKGATPVPGARRHESSGMCRPCRDKDRTVRKLVSRDIVIPHVKAGRDNDRTWQEIADDLGMSKSAVQKAWERWIAKQRAA